MRQVRRRFNPIEQSVCLVNPGGCRLGHQSDIENLAFQEPLLETRLAVFVGVIDPRVPKLAQPFGQVGCVRVIVAEQHPRIPVSSDLGQLMKLEARCKPRGRLMP